MADYKLHVLGDSPKDWCTVEIQAASDPEALAMAREICPGVAMELWSGQRLIRAFPGSPGRRRQGLERLRAWLVLRTAPEAVAYRLVR